MNTHTERAATAALIAVLATSVATRQPTGRVSPTGATGGVAAVSNAPSSAKRTSWLHRRFAVSGLGADSV